MVFLGLMSTRWIWVVFTLEQAHYGGSGSSGVGACPLLGGSVSTGLWLQGYGVLDLVPEHWHRGLGPGSPGGQSCFLLAVGLRGFKAACLLVGGSMSLSS